MAAAPGLPRRSFWALTAAYSFSSVQFWMTAPLAAVVLAERGVPAWQIGLLGAAPWLALTGLLPLAPRLAAGLGAVTVFHIGVGLGAAGALIFALSQNVALWALGYVLCGGGLAMRWIVADGIVAALSPPEIRGRTVGLFETVIGATLALGPALLLLTGVQGSLPFWVGVGLALAAAPFCFFIRVSPEALGRGKRPPGARDLLRGLATAPLGLALALAGGVVEGAGLKLFPVQALNAGFAESWAAASVAAMGAGNILTQYPAGRLSDHFSPRTMALTALTAMTVFALAAPAAAQIGPAWFLAALAGLGGASGALYTLAVIRAGAAGSALDAMGVIAGVGVVYTLGSVIGPAAGGFAITWAPQWGLSLLLATAGALGLAAARAAPR